MTMLNVLNEDGSIVGTASREEIHKQGLLHADVLVWFFTSNGEVFLQHRSSTKDVYPNLLDVTVGGHVEIGDTYEQTALKEAGEETGIAIDPAELLFLRHTISKVFDEGTGTTAYHLRNIYAYRFDGTVEDLRVESGEGVEFELWPIHSILALSEEEKARFTPTCYTEEGLEILREVQRL